MLNFNSSYLDEDGDVIDNRKKIFKSYFSGWFIVDFFSILPLEVLLLAIAKNTAAPEDA